MGTIDKYEHGFEVRAARVVRMYNLAADKAEASASAARTAAELLESEIDTERVKAGFYAERAANSALAATQFYRAIDLVLGKDRESLDKETRSLLDVMAILDQES